MHLPIYGWKLLQLVINFGVPYTDEYYEKWGGVLTIVFSFFPWSPFAKAIKDLGDATINSSEPGIKWSQRDSYCSVRCENSVSMASVDPCMIHFEVSKLYAFPQ